MVDDEGNIATSDDAFADSVDGEPGAQDDYESGLVEQGGRSHVKYQGHGKRDNHFNTLYPEQKTSLGTLLSTLKNEPGVFARTIGAWDAVKEQYGKDHSFLRPAENEALWQAVRKNTSSELDRETYLQHIDALPESERAAQLKALNKSHKRVRVERTANDEVADTIRPEQVESFREVRGERSLDVTPDSGMLYLERKAQVDKESGEVVGKDEAFLTSTYKLLRHVWAAEKRESEGRTKKAAGQGAKGDYEAVLRGTAALIASDNSFTGRVGFRRTPKHEIQWLAEDALAPHWLRLKFDVAAQAEDRATRERHIGRPKNFRPVPFRPNKRGIVPEQLPDGLKLGSSTVAQARKRAASERQSGQPMNFRLKERNTVGGMRLELLRLVKTKDVAYPLQKEIEAAIESGGDAVETLYTRLRDDWNREGAELGDVIPETSGRDDVTPLDLAREPEIHRGPDGARLGLADDAIGAGYEGHAPRSTKAAGSVGAPLGTVRREHKDKGIDFVKTPVRLGIASNEGDGLVPGTTHRKHIINVGGKKVGHVVLEKLADGTITGIHSISLLDVARNSGIGTQVIERVLKNQKQDITIRDVTSEQAKQFWKRFGVVFEGDNVNGVLPAPSGGTSAAQRIDAGGTAALREDRGGGRSGDRSVGRPVQTGAGAAQNSAGVERPRLAAEPQVGEQKGGGDAATPQLGLQHLLAADGRGVRPGETGRERSGAGRQAAKEEGSRAGQDAVADQLQAYLTLAEARGQQAVLAGALRTALKDHAAGARAATVQGALARAQKVLGELPATSTIAPVKQSQQASKTEASHEAMDDALYNEDYRALDTPEKMLTFAEHVVRRRVELDELEAERDLTKREVNIDARASQMIYDAKRYLESPDTYYGTDHSSFFYDLEGVKDADVDAYVQTFVETLAGKSKADGSKSSRIAASDPRKLFAPQWHEGFAKALDGIRAAFEKGGQAARAAGSQPLPMGRTPVVLRAVLDEHGKKVFRGSDYVVGAGSTVYLKGINQHALTDHKDSVPYSVLRNLPALLANPLAVFQSSANSADPHSFKVLIDAQSNAGLPVVVAFKPALAMQQLNGEAVNFQASIIPVSWSAVQAWNAEGLLRYYDERNPSILTQIAPHTRPKDTGASKPDSNYQGAGASQKTGFDPSVGVAAAPVNVMTAGTLEALPQAAWNAQTAASGRGSQRATPEEIAAAEQHILDTLGDSVELRLPKSLGDNSSGKWTPRAKKNLIQLALNGNVLGTAYHESLHEFFDLLGKSGNEATQALLKRAANNPLILRKLQKLLSEHPEAIKQLADPEEVFDATDPAAVARFERLFGKDFQAKDIQLDADGELDTDNAENQAAVMRWVNDAIMSPNASHRTIWGSDPHFQSFWHLKQFAYERDTWYDINGRIVFTNSKGLVGVGLPRKATRTTPKCRIETPDGKVREGTFGWEDLYKDGQSLVPDGTVVTQWVEDDTLPIGKYTKKRQYTAPFAGNPPGN